MEILETWIFLQYIFLFHIYHIPKHSLVCPAPSSIILCKFCAVFYFSPVTIIYYSVKKFSKPSNFKLPNIKLLLLIYKRYLHTYCHIHIYWIIYFQEINLLYRRTCGEMSDVSLLSFVQKTNVSSSGRSLCFVQFEQCFKKIME